MNAIRSVRQVIKPMQAHVGENFTIRRTLPADGLTQADPFLMLDHFGPFVQEAGAPGGVGPHPHKGFETVTYLLEGYVEHRDSTGARAVIGPGDVQWMTAGSGIVHSERPPEHFQKAGGTVHGMQLWVNLAAKDKGHAPRHQEVKATDMPSLQPAPGVTIKIAAGSYGDKASSIELLTPVTLLHVQLKAGASVALHFDVPTVIAQVMTGTVTAGNWGEQIPDGHLIQWSTGAGELQLTGVAETSDVFVLAGTPLSEPVFSYGPFVMNTQKEIWDAIREYETGKMGVLAE